jgi:hypothetical protein
MAKNVSVVITDDLDGSEGARTVVFSFDGVGYEIDLAEGNRAKLEEALAPFIAAARKAGRSRRGSSRPSQSVDRAAVRAWARQEGLNVSERGRISAEVLSRYEAAH